MYGLTGQLSFSLGCASIGFWIITQMPQMIENYRSGRADGLSAYFVLQWALGDSCNLVGCLLSGQQAVTETYTAVRSGRARAGAPAAAGRGSRSPPAVPREGLTAARSHARETQVWFVLSDLLLGAQYMYYKWKTRRERRLKRMLRKKK